MKEIQLTQGYVAKLDDEDYGEVSKFAWYAKIAPNGRIYAVRKQWLPDERRYKDYRMHRVILELHGYSLDGKVVDHINHDPLDNQKENIRVATRQQNNFNKRKLTKATSEFKGVHWDKSKSKWVTQIAVDGKSKHLGVFTDEIAAALAYNEAAMELFGEFATLNSLATLN